MYDLTELRLEMGWISKTATTMQAMWAFACQCWKLAPHLRREWADHILAGISGGVLLPKPRVEFDLADVGFTLATSEETLAELDQIAAERAARPAPIFRFD